MTEPAAPAPAKEPATTATAGIMAPATAAAGSESPPRLRAASACVACNMKKIRCLFPESGGKQCLNCARNRWECSPRERKRKRRKTVPADADASTRGASTHETAPRISSPQTSVLNSRLVTWEQSHPSVTSESSPSVVTPAHHPVPSHLQAANDAYPNSANHALAPPSERHGSHSYDPGAESSSFLGRSEYIGGDLPINEDQAKSYPAVATESLSPEDIRILQLQHAFDLPPRSVREGLIDAFMKRCAPWMPILERSWLAERSGNQPSILLLQAVFLAGSRVSAAPAVAAYASPTEFYRRAKALFWSGYEKNTVTVITAVCIMHWYNPDGPEHVSINTSGFWNRIGVGLAYQIGLHREPRQGRDAPLRRRLWWTLFARDCLISAGHGRPRAINPDDCDVRPLTPDDFYDTSADGSLFIPYVELCSLVGGLTQCGLRKYIPRQKRQFFENALYRWVRELPEHLKLFHKTFPAEGASAGKLQLVPYNFEARQLHVLYFIIIAILFRSSPPASTPSPASILASSFIAGIYEDFLARDEIRFLGPIFTFYLLASGVGLLSCLRYPHLWGRAEQDLQIIYNSQKELAKRWPSAIGSLKALHNMADEAGKLPRHTDTAPMGHLTPDQRACFSGLGTDLCRLGDILLAPPTHHPHELLDPRRSGTGANESEQYSRTASDMMTAGILAELKTPIGTPAVLDNYLPLATVVDATQSTGGGGIPGGTVEMTDEMLCTQYAGIGNWLIRDWDWNSDIAW